MDLVNTSSLVFNEKQSHFYTIYFLKSYSRCYSYYCFLNVYISHIFVNFFHRSPKENLYLLQIHFTSSRVVEVNLYFIVMFVVLYFNLCYSVIYTALLVVA